MVKVRGVLEVRVTKPKLSNKEAFNEAKNKRRQHKIYVIAAPKYSLEVQAENYGEQKTFQKNIKRVTIIKSRRKEILEGK
jgi:translation initiation factor 2 alpha subunit (eIF-2alpha)